MTMTRPRCTPVATEMAPKAIGPYSQAVKVEGPGLVFCSGQVPIDPATGGLVGGGIREQTHRVMENLKAVLVQAGASFSSVVKTTIYVIDLGDFAAVNEVYAGFFSGTLPARATVQVSALPLGSRVEIEMVALADQTE